MTGVTGGLCGLAIGAVAGGGTTGGEVAGLAGGEGLVGAMTAGLDGAGEPAGGEL